LAEALRAAATQALRGAWAFGRGEREHHPDELAPFQDAHRDDAWERAHQHPQRAEPPPRRRQELQNVRQYQALSRAQPVEWQLAPQGPLLLQLDAWPGAQLRSVERQAAQAVPSMALRVVAPRQAVPTRAMASVAARRRAIQARQEPRSERQARQQDEPASGRERLVSRPQSQGLSQQATRVQRV
jgi:hypothetical protein